ncbi:regulator of chromosome condensation 1/beta-lactamase-inhibitor protein II [Entophlyctis helioformis]|nr:regulator of chromosome condensation 1/beta-lactamase-inhibitor protein II [Entophlyctis helioformis]
MADDDTVSDLSDDDIGSAASPYIGGRSLSPATGWAQLLSVRVDELVSTSQRTGTSVLVNPIHKHHVASATTKPATAAGQAAQRPHVVIQCHQPSQRLMPSDSAVHIPEPLATPPADTLSALADLHESQRELEQQMDDAEAMVSKLLERCQSLLCPPPECELRWPKSGVPSTLDAYVDFLQDQTTGLQEQLYRSRTPRLLHSLGDAGSSLAEFYSVGMNDDGQLGIPNCPDTGGVPCSTTFRRSMMSACRPTKLVCGSMGVLVLADGRLSSWGFDECSGRVSGGVSEWVPGIVDIPAAVVDMACGEYVSCAVDVHGRLWAWGAFRDSKGDRMFSKTCPVSLKPQRLHFMDFAISVSAGESHLIVATRQGRIYTWGMNEFGQLGRPYRPSLLYTTFMDLVPTQVVLPTEAVVAQATRVAACGFSSFLMGERRGVWATGKNGYGELGVGDAEPRSWFIAVRTFESLRVVQIAGGLHHTLFLDDQGQLWACGRNTYGQLGIPGHEALLTPTRVRGLPPIRSIAAGTSSHHSYAIDVHGNLYATGQGDYGQLGQKNDRDSNVFLQVPLKDRRAILVAGGTHFTIVAIAPRS